MCAAFAQHNFCSGVYEALIQQVPTNHVAVFIGNADVNMAAMNANCSYKTYNFKMPRTLVASGFIGIANIELREAAHAGKYTSSLQLMLLRIGNNTFAQVFAGLKS
jgi:hypothetical protein